MNLSLLDTDMLSELLKQRDLRVSSHALQYQAEHGLIAFSAISKYEVLRGYRLKGAQVQEARFLLFCGHCEIVPITDAILDRAATLWATAGRNGLARNDADLFIAATALEQGRTLVTGNTRHFRWIDQLTLSDWRVEATRSRTERSSAPSNFAHIFYL